MYRFNGTSPGLTLRNLMNKKCVPIPGAFNGLVARLVAQTGFEATYISGGAITAASGQPDIGLMSLDRFCSHIKEVALNSELPVLADADTGFGEGEMVTKTVWEYHLHGAAGCHLEDQVFPKRCGHLDGKSLVPVTEFVQKIEKAVAASQACSNGEFIICARTDAFSVEGFESAVRRATAYVEAGAEMIFPEGLNSYDDFKRFSEAMRVLKGPAPQGGPYLLANMTEFGKTDYLNLKQFEELGYNCVIYPVSTLRIAMKAVENMLTVLKDTGSVESTVPEMFTRQDLYSTLQYTPGTEYVYPGTNHDIKKETTDDTTTDNTNG